MGGLAVLLLVGLYFVLTIVAIVRVKPVWTKGLVLLAALLIPTADAVYGRYKLQQMCKAEAGLKVYRVVHGVEGFMDVDASSDYWIKKHGYKYVERIPSNQLTTRWFWQNGQIVIEEKAYPRSKYKVDHKYVGWLEDNYLRSKYFIHDMHGAVLSTDTQIGFNGGWAERFLAMFSDAGIGTVAWCSDAELDTTIRHRRIIINTLKHSGE